MIDQAPFSDASEVLLQELSHRICNNFQILAAMISSLHRETPISTARNKLEKLAEGVFAFANLHRSLLCERDQCLHSAIDQVCADVVRGFNRGDVELFLYLHDIPLTSMQRHRLLLMVVELVTNALKHSLAAVEGGAIWIDIRRRDEALRLEVYDSSEGSPVSAHHRPSRLVEMIAESLGGTAWVFDRNGFATGVSFPLQYPVIESIGPFNRPDPSRAFDGTLSSYCR